MGQLARIIMIGFCLAFSNLTLTSSAWAQGTFSPGTLSQDLSEADSLFNQGKIYHDGLGVTQNFNTARIYYERAAALGSKEAQLNLGYLYFVGEGVTRDFYAARQWYEKAALAGDKSAAQNLIYMDQQKLGLSPNRSQSPLPTPVKDSVTVFTKPMPIAMPTAAMVKTSENPIIATLNDDSTLTTFSTAATNSDTSFSTVSVFGSIILIAIGLGGLVGWAADQRAARKRGEVQELARQFFEHNRRLLREIYIRYPSAMYDIDKRNSGSAVAISVLIVRFVIFRTRYTDPDSPALPKNLSSEILSPLKSCPAKARHAAFKLVPDLINLIKSDIRAFDIEHATKPEAPPIYKSPRRNPRKLVWEPRIVATH